ncbi:N-acetylmuramoyl-L-alanine amidase [Viridibacillus sp. YIM B01967]|uniref:N-acetylmuramoyl-L-alanine amidase n=1 Tax=Viridibacillus soli TaxID=2798301 RepID=A0ABS1H7C8_9BACL|nr:N-acetylmuramoyl-L-alanine amidase [Viridibacillus soli]MBK3495311.1 N-acetylmuramoyl-L-alanine amidase [Viridibacillus soli]
MVKKFVISSGHALKVCGAKGILEEVNEARKVTNCVYEILTEQYNGEGHKFHDDTSTTQNQNLNTIVKYHNSKIRDLDISVHFNAASKTSDPRGAECLYYDAKVLSAKVSAEIASVSGLKDRGPKERKELYFLNSTNQTAILIEVCFVDSTADTEIYNEKFEAICQGIAVVVASELGYKKKEVTAVSKPVNKPSTNNNEGYYKKDTGLYRIKKACNAYNGVNFGKSKKVQALKVNEKYTIVDIVKSGNAYRLKTKSGLYITAKKEFVDKV